MKSSRAIKILISCLLTLSSTILLADMNLRVVILNSRVEVTTGQKITHTAHLYDMVALELHAEFTNNSAGVETAELRGTGLNDFLGRWQDMSRKLVPGETIFLRDTVYIRITSDVSQLITAHTELRDNNGAWVAGEFSHSVEIRINVDASTSSFPRPVIKFNPEKYSKSYNSLKYAGGTSNILNWTAARPSGSIDRIIQDAYYFDINNPHELHKAIGGLYKTVLDINRISRFDGLEDGRTYGYLIKSVYETASDSITLYSDVYYSTQDNSPPSPVIALHADLDQNHLARLTWTPVSDLAVNGRASGVKSYLIIRSIDTGRDVVADTVEANAAGIWNDNLLITGVNYHYKVYAVDSVGNVGTGQVSNSVFWNGDVWPADDGHELVRLPAGSGSGYFKGTVDTLTARLEGWEKEIKFQVVRDDTAYFTNPTSTPLNMFDSGWQVPGANTTISWNPDYAGNAGTNLNFINNHIYFRRLYRKDVNGTITFIDLGQRIADCLPPVDLPNLAAKSIITDSRGLQPAQGYNSWQVELGWSQGSDGASGIKAYHVFRRIAGLDNDYIEIGPGNDILENGFIDKDFPVNNMISNTAVSYKVIAEDYVGNQRDLSEAGQEANLIALAAPKIKFEHTFAQIDTFFTSAKTIDMRLYNIQNSLAQKYIVSVNGVEKVFELSDVVYPGLQDVLFNVSLDLHQLSRIKARVIYQGGRSSVWTAEKVVSLRCMPPHGLATAVAAAAPGHEWDGNINLSWVKGSLDNRHYQVWRKENGTVWQPVDTLVVNNSDTVIWVDYYNKNELSGQTSPPLVAYRAYQYKVRMISTTGKVSAFSDSITSYCSKPPEIVSHSFDTVNGQPAIRINWVRAVPSDASGSFKTRVYVYLDTEDNLEDSTGTGMMNDVQNKTSFVYRYNPAAASIHNYIFRLYEEVLSPAAPFNKSNLSKPRNVKLITIDSLFVIAQPGGNIYLNWEPDTLIDKLAVTSYRITREGAPAAVTTAEEYMDTVNLKDKQTYHYTLSAMNALNQVLAQGTRTVVCDFGRAFIPDTVELTSRYFIPRTIMAGWNWYDDAGVRLTGTTTGAKWLRIQASASELFDTELTDTGWFPADTITYQREIVVPDVIDSNNEKVYIRMTARDRFGHPGTAVWSETTTAIFDTLRPVPVQEMKIDSIKSYYKKSDMVMVQLSWSDQTSYNPAFPANTNIDKYEIVRRRDNMEWIAGYADSKPGLTRFTFVDTIQNQLYNWSVVSIDSAGNRTKDGSIQNVNMVETPASPLPDSTKRCSWQPISSASATTEYFVEIAQDSLHFSWAYELGISDENNNLLCRSAAWQTSLVFTCESGWGSIHSDTTWFRVKARQGIARESGWSIPGFYISKSSQSDPAGKESLFNQPPVKFKVLQNYPNPFNASTVISYELSENAEVTLAVYNLQGKKVKQLASDIQSSGRYQVTWHGVDEAGQNIASGIYFCQVSITTNDGHRQQQRIKMVIVK